MWEGGMNRMYMAYNYNSDLIKTEGKYSFVNKLANPVQLSASSKCGILHNFIIMIRAPTLF
jgi:hypothetical protein